MINDFNINTKLKRRYKVDSTYFDNINSEDKAYILGFIYADGFVGDEKYNNIVISSKDKEILEMIKEKINFSGQITKHKPGGYNNSKENYSLAFSDKKIAFKLRELGIHAYRKKEMNSFPCISNELKRHFLRGYFDGDGSISKCLSTTKKNDKVYQYERLLFSLISSKDFLQDIVETYDIEQYSLRKSHTEGLYYLNVMAILEIYKLYHLLYDNSTIFLNRKKKIWDENIGAYNQK